MKDRQTAEEILAKYGLRSDPMGRQHYYTTCPKCSADRKLANRKERCLHINVDAYGVRFFCNNCPNKGGEYYDGSFDASKPGGGRLFRGSGDRAGNGRTYGDLHRAARRSWR